MWTQGRDVDTVNMTRREGGDPLHYQGVSKGQAWGRVLGEIFSLDSCQEVIGVTPLCDE
jgi:hypothetical protein